MLGRSFLDRLSLVVTLTCTLFLLQVEAVPAASSTPAAKAARKLDRGAPPSARESLVAPRSLLTISRGVAQRRLRGLAQPPARKLALRLNPTTSLAGRIDVADLRTADGMNWAQIIARRRQPAHWQVGWDANVGTPRTIELSGKLSGDPGALVGAARPSAASEPRLQALATVTEHAGFFRLHQPATELHHLQTQRDSQGGTHVRFERRIEGIPVWGEDLVFHLTPTGQLLGYNGHYSPSDVTVEARHDISASQAIDTATEQLQQRIGRIDVLDAPVRRLLQYEGPQAQLCYVRGDQGLRLAWQVEIRPNLRDRYRYFIDAADGRVADWYNATASDGAAQAVATDALGIERQLQTFEAGGEFLLLDASRPMFATDQPDVINNPRGAILTLDAQGQDLTARSPIFQIFSPDNRWLDPVAVSAHYHAGTVFQYFLDTHTRLGIDGHGGSMISVVHVTDGGEPMDNAYWNGAFMAYGDGDQIFDPLAAALDITAHEMTHGVIERTVNLEYRGQSGALNESFADVFAVMVDRDDWLLGEDVTRGAFFPTGALRDMEDPNNGGGPRDFFWQPGHMDEFVSLPDSIDNGGVHINSGIPNRACFLIADAIGRDKTERIYYRILDARYLNIRANFQDLRWAANRAASDLFGASSSEVAAVDAAFAAVGIGIDGRYEAPVARAPGEGEQWLVVVNADGFDTSLFLVRAELETEQDIFQLTQTQVFTQSGNTVSAAADGSFVLFVDADNNLRVINADGSDETILSDTGDWSSIALSPDGTRLAATTVFIDTTIFIIDLVNPDDSREIKLRGATTQEGIEANVVLFADAMDWDPDSQTLIYDAFHRVPTATGEGFTYWNVNVLDVAGERSLTLFPPQPEGLHLGNPAFSRTTGRHVVFDFYDDETSSNEIWVYDIVSGAAGLIVSTPSFGFPTFSNDDTEVAFERFSESGSLNIARVPLSQNKLSAARPAQDFLFEAQSAKWLLRPGDEVSTAVEEEAQDSAQPTLLQLAPNAPNPFNPVTSIGFELPAAGRVILRIYDIRGAHVIDLIDQMHSAGSYRASWSGIDAAGQAVASGVYLYRLRWQGADGTHQQITRRMALVR